MRFQWLHVCLQGRVRMPIATSANIVFYRAFRCLFPLNCTLLGSSGRHLYNKMNIVRQFYQESTRMHLAYKIVYMHRVYRVSVRRHGTWLRLRREHLNAH